MFSVLLLPCPTCDLYLGGPLVHARRDRVRYGVHGRLVDLIRDSEYLPALRIEQNGWFVNAQHGLDQRDTARPSE